MPYAAHAVSRHAVERGNRHEAEGRSGVSGDERSGRQLRKRDSDEVSISSHSGERGNYPAQFDQTGTTLPGSLKKIKNPDARLASWFRTVLSLQETPERSGSRISIYA